MKGEQKIKIIKLALAVLAIIIISVVLKLNNVSSVAEIIELIRSSGRVGIIVYILLFSFLPTFFVTVTILAISAGAVFGFWPACIYTFVGAFLNSTFTYIVSKYFAYDLINDYANSKYRVEYEKLKKNTKGKEGFILMIVLRLLPLVPYTFLNYLSGVVGYDYKVFISSTLLGIIPGMLCYVNIGASSINGFSPKLVVSISILIVFMIITTILAKKFYYKKND